MYERIRIEEVASILGIKARVLESDIKDLAWLWEMTVKDVTVCDSLGALDVLAAIAKAYLRGRNCRMGSYQTLLKHLPTKAAVMYLMADHVAEENEDHVFYQHLRDCGVISAETFVATAAQMNRERIRKREEEEKHQKEQAKEEAKQKTHEYVQRLKEQQSYNILDEVRKLLQGGNQP